MQQVNKNREINSNDILEDNIKQKDEQFSPVFGLPEIPVIKESGEPKKDLNEKGLESDLLKEDDNKKHTTKKPLVSATTSKISPQILLDENIEVKKIEEILAEGLADIYKIMDPATQNQFKIQGEDTSRAINILLHKTKVKVREIVSLIIKWLKIIPAVNKFFIEQQAKIKTDKLMAMRRDREKNGG